MAWPLLDCLQCFNCLQWLYIFKQLGFDNWKVFSEMVENAHLISKKLKYSYIRTVFMYEFRHRENLAQITLDSAWLTLIFSPPTSFYKSFLLIQGWIVGIERRFETGTWRKYQHLERCQERGILCLLLVTFLAFGLPRQRYWVQPHLISGTSRNETLRLVIIWLCMQLFA